MAELFVLNLTDEIETVSFVNDSSDTYYLMDGGFDIGMPKTTRELKEARPGFFKLIRSQKNYREATIRFSIKAQTADRTDIINALNKIERILSQIEYQSLLDDSTRGALQYAWDGASVKTYFEVFGGDITMPGDTISVWQQLSVIDGVYFMTDIELKLYLSPVGYNKNILSPSINGDLITLYNDTYTTPATTIQISNSADSADNWVEIAAGQVPGGSPLITQMILSNVGSGLYIDKVYIGHSLAHSNTPIFPAKADLHLESSEISIMANGGTVSPTPADTSHSSASGGSYLHIPWEDTTGFHDDGALVYNPGSMQTYGGTYFALMELFTAVPSASDKFFGLGYFRGETIDGINWVNPRTTSSGNTHPLGIIQFPPLGRVPRLNTSQDNEGGLYQGRNDVSSGEHYDIDYIAFLPIDAGFRVLKNGYDWIATGASADIILYDDAWRGMEYAYEESGFGTRTNKAYGMLEPITLLPNRTQRLHFHTQLMPGQSSYQKTRQWNLSIRVIQTFATLAY